MTQTPLAVGFTMERRDTPVAPLTWCAAAVIDPFARLGAVPLLLPNPVKPERARAWLDGLAALVLTDGVPPSSFLYGENPRMQNRNAEPRRDATEIVLYRAAREKGLPVLGIGRGMQMINWLEGGSLWQDLTQEGAQVGPHCAEEAPPLRHYITTEPDSWARRALGERAVVLSAHRGGVRVVAPGFRATATADDGVIEAIESADGAPVFGIQWPLVADTETEAVARAFWEAIQ